MAKMLLNNAKLSYDIVDAPVDKDLCVKFGVKNAPTLLVPNGDTYTKLENASEIKKYIEGLK